LIVEAVNAALNSWLKRGTCAFLHEKKCERTWKEKCESQFKKGYQL